MFTYVKNAVLFVRSLSWNAASIGGPLERIQSLGVAYRRTKATRDADSFWIVPGTLDINEQ